jgi:hypothetical protein
MKSSTFAKIFLTLALFLTPVFVGADVANPNLSGWAWSSNIGWISFNASNQNDSKHYGVNFDTNSSTFTGHAWSPNIGWISFDQLTGFPTSGADSMSDTSADSSTGNFPLYGWARALAYGDGWDGWISLSGTGYGITFDGTYFDGYAWGDSVLGWIDFSPPCPNIECGVRISDYGNIVFDIKSGGQSLANKTDVPYLTAPTYEWTITDSPSANCSLSKTSAGGTAFSTINNIASTGSTVGNSLTNAAYNFQLACTNPNVTKEVSFTVAPQAPGFSLSGPEEVRIQFLTPNAANSETIAMFVDTVGGFSEDVTLSLDSFPSLADTTFLYSFDSGVSYSASPTKKISHPYSSGIGFSVKVTRAPGAPAFLADKHSVRLVGTSPGMTTAYKVIKITPAVALPAYEEL